MSGADQGLNVDDWAGEMGRNWLANLARFEGMIAPIGEALIDHAGFSPGDTVLDLGCGGGATTIAIAAQVSPGRVTGMDISSDLIDHARLRARDAGANLDWFCGDAARAIPPEAPFDRLFSRFGSMFFGDAEAGFRNLRKMLKGDGRIDLAVWAPPAENEWTRLIAGVVARYLPDLPKPDPRAPGPFAFSDTAWLTHVLQQGRFERITIMPFEARLAIGGFGATAQEAAAFVVAGTHMGRMLQAAGSSAVDDLAAAFAPHHVPGEGTLIGGKAWIVTAVAA
jgi:SAM-dependent methyltransferase